MDRPSIAPSAAAANTPCAPAAPAAPTARAARSAARAARSAAGAARSTAPSELAPTAPSGPAPSTRAAPSTARAARSNAPSAPAPTVRAARSNAPSDPAPTTTTTRAAPSAARAARSAAPSAPAPALFEHCLQACGPALYPLLDTRTRCALRSCSHACRAAVDANVAGLTWRASMHEYDRPSLPRTPSIGPSKSQYSYLLIDKDRVWFPAPEPTQASAWPGVRQLAWQDDRGEYEQLPGELLARGRLPPTLEAFTLSAALSPTFGLADSLNP